MATRHEAFDSNRETAAPIVTCFGWTWGWHASIGSWKWTLLTTFLLPAGFGCATSGAPPGWLPDVEQVQVEPYGAWARVTPIDPYAASIYGELLALGADTLHFLIVGTAEVRSLSRDQIRSVRLFWFDASWRSYAIWSVLGTLGTISHGFGLALSAPIWALSGLGVTRERSQDPLVEYPDQSWSVLSTYARYPQGMPPGLSSVALRPVR